jgi:asparagine synthase (glutamine-hydrolysing)
MVLPDRPDARQVWARRPWPSPWMVGHASGSPWLVGSLDQDEVTLATVGSLRVAVISSCPVTATRLTDLVTRVRTVAELEAVARRCRAVVIWWPR